MNYRVTQRMNKLLLILFVFPVSLMAAEISSDVAGVGVTGDIKATGEAKTVSSPRNRVAVLELYTSEGCSSCPPADRFLSQIKDTGISSKQLIPMAFHVTYWDYIGWNDRFAKKQYDQRQRKQAQKHNSTSVYTPQFLLSGDDYRRYANFSNDVDKLVKQKSLVDLTLTVQVGTDIGNKAAGSKAAGSKKAGSKKAGAQEILHLTANTDISKSGLSKAGVYFVVLENNLTSNVGDGENEGETLHHDYVVRQMYGPYFQGKSDNQQPLKQQIALKSEWKKQDLSIVMFAENPVTGEVLQAARLRLSQL